jgi:hypothetical protein
MSNIRIIYQPGKRETPKRRMTVTSSLNLKKTDQKDGGVRRRCYYPPDI